MANKYENLESDFHIQYDVQSDGTVCLYHTNEEHCAWLTKADLQRMLLLLEDKETKKNENP